MKRLTPEQKLAILQLRIQAENARKMREAKIEMKGEKGEMPAHRWRGTQLQFQNPDGTWGVLMNLRGIPGDKGNEGKPGKDGKQGKPGKDGVFSPSEKRAIIKEVRALFNEDIKSLETEVSDIQDRQISVEKLLKSFDINNLADRLDTFETDIEDLKKRPSGGTQGGGSSVTIKKNGAVIGSGTAIDFRGSVDVQHNGNTAVVTVTGGSSLSSTDDLAEGATNLYFTNERVDDRINALFVAGTGIEFVYDDAANTFTITSTATGGGAVDSVNGKTGVVVLTTTDIAEGTNAYWTAARFNTAFSAKSTTELAEGTNLYYTQARFDTAFGLKSTSDLSEGSNLYYTNARADARITAQKGVANGVATLDSGGKIPTSQLPALAITDTFVVASQAAMLALTAETGDVAVRSDLNKSFILKGTDPTTLTDWQELLTPTDSVLSVNGSTGAVTLTTTNISEGSNLYYTDERVDDRVAVLIQNGTGITWSYNDTAGTLTPTVSLAAFSTTNLGEGSNLYFTDERAQDAVGNILTDSATIDFTYDDAGNTITAIVKDASITEAMQTLADNTTNDVSTSAHGYVPKAPNDTTKFLRGDATWAVPSASLSVASGATTWNSASTGTQTIAHGLGKTPSITHIKAMFTRNTTSTNHSTLAYAEAVITGGVTSYMYGFVEGGTATSSNGSASQNGNTFTLYYALSGGTNVNTAATITVDATNISLTWSKTGAPTGTISIIWDVLG